VQAEAAPPEVARGGGLYDGLADLHRQDRRPGPEEEKAHQHRGVSEGRPRAALPQAAQALGPGDILAGRQLAARKGGCASVVLQSAAEGKADDAAEHARGRDDGGHAPRQPHAPQLRPPPGHARLPHGPALALPQSPYVVSPRHGPPVDGALASSPLGLPVAPQR
jgi:hypothetical protein